MSEHLVCPLCNHEEFMISDHSQTLICAQCGSFFKAIDKIKPELTDGIVINPKCIIKGNTRSH